MPVVVRDAHGKAINGLTKDDFQIFDKGKRQAVSGFSVAKSDTEAKAATGATPAIVAKAPEAVKKPASNPSRADRYVAYLFDDRDARLSDLAAARDAALRHFKTSPAADHAGIYTFSGRTTLDFTTDKDKLEQTIKSLRNQTTLGHDAGDPCPDVTYYLADLIVNANVKTDSIANAKDPALEAAKRQTMQCLPTRDESLARWIALSAAKKVVSIIGPEDTRVALGRLRETIRRLAEVEGQRLIVLASPGFFPRTPDERIALGEVLDLAAKNSVIINSLDIRGVYTSGHDTAMNPIPSTDVEEQYYLQSSLSSGDVLDELARGTGGILFHNNNNLTLGFERVTSPPEVYYLVGFSPQDLKADGSFHALKIRVNRKGSSVQARNGYFAPAARSTAKKTPEEEIHDAVFSREEISEIPLDVAAQVSKSGNSAADLLVVARVHAECLKFQKLDGRNHDSLTVVYAMFDDAGAYVEGNVKTVNLALNDETIAGETGINAQSSFVMKPGAYLARVVVRDGGGKTLSAHTLAVTIR